MPRGRKPRIWIKLDCAGVLGGSINYLIPKSQQIIWIKMICFSEVCGGRPGYIEDNNENGLPHEYISHQLQCDVVEFENVLSIMTKDGAVESNGTGSIHLVNFDHYQFSEYDRQKPYRDAKKVDSDPDKFTRGKYGKMTIRNIDSIEDYNPEKAKRLKETPGISSDED